MINQGYYLLCFISALLSIYNAVSPVQGVSSSSNPNSHDEVQRAILEDFFQAVPVSDACSSKVAVGSVVPTEISFNHTDPSSSNFSPQNLPYEKDLFLVEMFYPSVDNLNNTWRLRLGSGWFPSLLLYPQQSILAYFMFPTPHPLHVLLLLHSSRWKRV